MEEKLKEILDQHEEQLARYEDNVEKLRAKMNFCKTHKFEEEYRITNVEYQALDMAIYRWRDMHKEISALLNTWLS
jgi:hypothetical protein